MATDDLSAVAQARLASGLTIDDAATALGIGRSTYASLEARPLSMTVGELHALCAELNRDGRNVLMPWLLSFVEVDSRPQTSARLGM